MADADTRRVESLRVDSVHDRFISTFVNDHMQMRGMQTRLGLFTPRDEPGAWLVAGQVDQLEGSLVWFEDLRSRRSVCWLDVKEFLDQRARVRVEWLAWPELGALLRDRTGADQSLIDAVSQPVARHEALPVSYITICAMLTPGRDTRATYTRFTSVLMHVDADRTHTGRLSLMRVLQKMAGDGHASATAVVLAQVNGENIDPLLHNIVAASRVNACRTCGKPDTRRCMGCRTVVYCSKDCQRADWLDRHNAACGYDKLVLDIAIAILHNPEIQQ